MNRVLGAQTGNSIETSEQKKKTGEKENRTLPRLIPGEPGGRRTEETKGLLINQISLFVTLELDQLLTNRDPMLPREFGGESFVTQKRRVREMMEWR